MTDQSSETPLVSCIMPTRNRRAFVPAAIAAFLAQDYERRELVIVDDGTDPIGDLVPDDPRVRYERVARRMRLGAKRNLACRLAAGDVVVHWDDDDWSARWRLTYQVGELLRTGADVCGLREILFFDPRTERAWRYVHPPNVSRPWVAGGTLCYRKGFWRGHSFAEVNVGEDTRFVWDGRPNIVALEDPSFYVATIHARNTSPKRPGGGRWQPADAAEVKGLLDDGGLVPAARTWGSPGDPATAGLRVTVSIPYYGCKQYIRRAVDGVLAQTHRNLRVVVVNDADPDPPWPLLEDIDDPRLVRFDLSHNAGRYFADAVVLAATDDDYFLVHDADDWSDPRRVEMLLGRLVKEDAGVAVSAIGVVRSGSGGRIVRPKVDGALGGRVRHLADHHALFRRDALLRVGGCFGGLRIGYDTLLMNLMLMTASVTVVDEPLYHRLARPGSLTTAPDTGFGSPERARVGREVERRYGLAYEAYRKQGSDKESLAEELREIARGPRDPDDDRRLKEEAARLRALLGAASPIDLRPRTPGIFELLGDQHLWRGNWAIRRSTALELWERLRARGSERLLEAGSGTSTLVLAAHAASVGGRVVTLEHEERYARATRALLHRYGLAEWADVVHAPLEAVETGPARGHPWYGTALDGTFEFALVDGPPMARGREAALLAIHPHLADDWEVWLHDARREHERSCLDLWRRHLDFVSAERDLDDAGVCVLAPRAEALPGAPAVPDDVAVSILTGHRPALLQQTISSLTVEGADVLGEAYVCVMINGADPVTEEYVRSLPFVDEVLTEATTKTIGAATSALLAHVAARSGAAYSLHLEDDWFLCTLDSDCIFTARRLLESDERVGQVRLRHRSDSVLTRHMVTGRPISWQQRDDHAFSPAAHFTFNPNMTRLSDLERIFPAVDERDAQRRFLRTGLGTAQLTPGAFRHIGDGASLRSRLDRAAGAPLRPARARRRRAG